MSFKGRFLIYLNIFFCFRGSVAQELSVQFEHLSIEQGLSQSTVNCILQDSKGYMWFGTLNGLNRYDGYTFTDYRHFPDNPKSISNDQIFALFEDREKNLWVGTLDGLNRLDRKDQTFYRYFHDPEDPYSLSANQITSIFQDKSGALWVGTVSGLNKFDAELQTFTQMRFQPNEKLTLSSDAITSIYEDSKGFLWVGTTGGGLNRINPARNEIQYYAASQGPENVRYTTATWRLIESLKQNQILSLGEIGDHVDSLSTVVNIVDTTDVLILSMGEVTDVEHDFGQILQDGEVVWQMRKEKSRHGGGALKNRIQLELMSLPPGEYRLRYISDDSHGFGRWNHLAPDHSDWWGVHLFAVDVQAKSDIAFLLQKEYKPRGLTTLNIRQMCQDKDGNFFIATAGGGLNKLILSSQDGNDSWLSHAPASGTQLDYHLIPQATPRPAFASLRNSGPNSIDGVKTATQGSENIHYYYRNDKRWRKTFNSAFYATVQRLLKQRKTLSEISRVDDGQEIEREFLVNAPTIALVVGIGEMTRKRHDYGQLLTNGKTIFDMQLANSRHAGGSIKNRMVAKVLDLHPGKYSLSFTSDGSHSFNNWNDRAPDYPELWGVRVVPLEQNEIPFLKSLMEDTLLGSAIAGNQVRDVIQDRYGDMWVATGNGLAHLDVDNDVFTNYRHDPTDPNSIAANDVNVVYEDRTGSIWVGTVLGGISKFNRNKNRFPKFSKNPFVDNSLSNKLVYGLLEDLNGFIWIGTWNGIDVFDPETKSFLNLRNSGTPADKIAGNVLGISKDLSGRIWFATSNAGVFRIDNPDFIQRKTSAGKSTLVLDNAITKSKDFLKQYLPAHDDPNSLSSTGIWFVKQDAFGDVWVGTRGGGLNRIQLAENLPDSISEKKDRFTRYFYEADNAASLAHNNVRTVLEDRQGVLWFGTHGGLCKYDRDTNLFKSYRNDPEDEKSLSFDAVTCIYEDEQGNLWVATYGGGLNKFDRNTETFARFLEKDGLPNNVVYGILADNFGNIWVSTNNGISRMTPATKSFKNYDMDNGLQSNEFNTGGYLRTRDDKLIFGGVNGFNIIDPARIRDNSVAPAIVITEFKKFDEKVQFDKDISELEEIELCYKENFFSFEFAALDYTNPGKNEYAYMLEGLHDDWIYCGARRFATFTNLSPGNYTFRVKASNNDGIWNTTGAAIKIVITPPFWMTNWFLSLTGLMVIMALVLLHKYRVRQKIKQSLRMERVRFQERERMREQVSRDYHDELGHKLTKITLFSELLRRDLNGHSSDAKGHLHKIMTASQSLTRDTRDFIWTLNPEKDKLYDLAVYLGEFGDALFEGTDCCFEMDKLSRSLENIKLRMEMKRHLALIMKEAMNNILKHADARLVRFSIAAIDGEIQVKLSDNGHGFSEKDCVTSNGHGNGIMNMKKRAENMGAQIQINSEVQRGTEIRLICKIPPNGYLKSIGEL